MRQLLIYMACQVCGQSQGVLRTCSQCSSCRVKPRSSQRLPLTPRLARMPEAYTFKSSNPEVSQTRALPPDTP